MAEIRRPLIVDAGRRRLLAASEVLPGASIDQIAGLAPTLDLDFEHQVYRHYSPATGLREKPLSDIVTFTRSSTATYFDARGVMQTAGNNVPRIDFDPVTGECKGLLIEESRTNLLTYSEQFDHATWQKVRSSIVVNQMVAPDGTLTADKLVEDTTANATHPVSSITTTLDANTAISASVFVRAAERTHVVLRLISGPTDNIVCSFNLSTGTVGTLTNGGGAFGGSGTITSVGNGWFRCSIAGVLSPAGPTPRLDIYPAIGTALDTTGWFYTGNGTSGLYIWGAQLERGSFPSSYIKTEAATVTRAADVAVISGTVFSDFYGASGTLIAKYMNDGVMHVASPSLSTLDLAYFIDDAAQVNDRISRLVFFPRVLSATTIGQIKAAL